MPNVYHVVPINDLRDHEESEKCWCHPRVEEDGALIVHNSMDGRELIERGEKRVQ